MNPYQSPRPLDSDDDRGNRSAPRDFVAMIALVAACFSLYGGTTLVDVLVEFTNREAAILVAAVVSYTPACFLCFWAIGVLATEEEDHEQIK